MHTVIVVVHVCTATLALGTGIAAYTFRNNTPRHRRLGIGYIAGWIGFAVTGLILGARDPAISVFEVLTVLGAVFVGLGLGTVKRRDAIGPAWITWHYRWMLTSLAFVVIATINQLLLQAGWRLPLWAFIGLSLTPFLVIPRLVDRLDRRYAPTA